MALRGVKKVGVHTLVVCAMFGCVRADARFLCRLRELFVGKRAEPAVVVAPVRLPAKLTFATKNERIALVIALLARHPDILSANLTYRRNLLELAEHIPRLQELLGDRMGSVAMTPSRVLETTTGSAPRMKYDEAARAKFLADRADDLAALDLQPGADLDAQLVHLKETTRDDPRRFRKQVAALYRLLPVLYDGRGKPRAVEKIPDLKFSEIDDGYRDLVHHLEPTVTARAREPGFGEVGHLFETFQKQFVDKTVRKVLTQVADTTEGAAVSTLSLERLPPIVGLYRGSYGGDCSILTVPFHALHKDARVYFIRDGGTTGRPIGYAMSVLVEHGGKKIPYLVTVNGLTLDAAQVRGVARMVAADFGTTEIVLPDFKENPNVVNTQVIRDALKFSGARDAKVTMPAGWDLVDKYTMERGGAGHRNYYDGAKLATARVVDLGAPETEIKTTDGPPAYRIQEKPGDIRPFERALLAAQTGDHAMAENLGVTPAQVRAVQPFLDLAKDRPLTAKEYREAAAHVGTGLSETLSLAPAVRAVSLREIYKTDHALFGEHRLTDDGRFAPALAEAWELARQPELVRRIARAGDLAPAAALELLSALRAATAGDVGMLHRALIIAGGKSVARAVADYLASIYRPGSSSEVLHGLSSPDRSVMDFFARLIRDPAPEDPKLFATWRALGARIDRGAPTLDAAAAQFLAGPASDGDKVDLLVAIRHQSRYAKWLAEVSPDARRRVETLVEGRSTFSVYEKLARAQRVDPILLGSGEQFGTVVVAGGGTVTLGTGDSFESPKRDVTITRSFHLGQAPITRLQWALVMGETPTGVPDAPIDRVSWDDAREFTRRLSAADPSFKYRLPTEAEWEYAAITATRAGLAEMTGRVNQWMDDPYTGRPSGGKDPVATESNRGRTVKGGAAGASPEWQLPGARSNIRPEMRFDGVGFRIVREPK